MMNGVGETVKLRHGSLFSGIGGFDLAAEWVGWENIFHCEINEFCNKVLNHYWPKAQSIKNIISYEWENWRGKIDVLSGGFPCQPYSSAGKRLGKQDPRHLWPEMLRAVQGIRPRWVVGENVRGLISWNEGLVFDEVQSDLETEGYEVLPFLLPAAGVNAPHRRERIWFIAHCAGVRRQEKWRDGNREIKDKAFRSNIRFDLKRPGEIGIAADTNNAGNTASGCGVNTYGQTKIEGWEQQSFAQPGGYSSEGVIADSSGLRGGELLHNIQCKEPDGEIAESINEQNNWANWPAQSPICNGNNGLPTRLDSITFPKWRNESIRAGGNAIVPQVALQIFRIIQQSIT